MILNQFLSGSHNIKVPLCSRAKHVISFNICFDNQMVIDKCSNEPCMQIWTLGSWLHNPCENIWFWNLIQHLVWYAYTLSQWEFSSVCKYILHVQAKTNAISQHFKMVKCRPCANKWQLFIEDLYPIGPKQNTWRK